MSECETPVAFERDSPSNARSKFNAEGGEWSQAKSYLSVSGSKFSERSASLRADVVTPRAYRKCAEVYTPGLAKKSVSPHSICSGSKGGYAVDAQNFNICQFSDQFSSKTMKQSQGSQRNLRDVILNDGESQGTGRTGIGFQKTKYKKDTRERKRELRIVRRGDQDHLSHHSHDKKKHSRF